MSPRCRPQRAPLLSPRCHLVSRSSPSQPFSLAPGSVGTWLPAAPTPAIWLHTAGTAAPCHPTASRAGRQPGGVAPLGDIPRVGSSSSSSSEGSGGTRGAVLQQSPRHSLRRHRGTGAQVPGTCTSRRAEGLWDTWTHHFHTAWLRHLRDLVCGLKGEILTPPAPCSFHIQAAAPGTVSALPCQALSPYRNKEQWQLSPHQPLPPRPCNASVQLLT